MEPNQLEVSPPEAASSAARAFAAALAETTQFKAFEQAYDTLRKDSPAQEALAAYREKARSLQAMLMLSAVEEAERAELERLKQDYLSRPGVRAYNAAEADLIELSQAVAGRISEAIGLNYAASCGASCCG
jgi:cell fate (sporulation/competence/biofilm development) regulator YlbF (YheA/YmcA/DUF963 family)